MTSTRTQYRQKRKDLIIECITLLARMLTLKDKDLEKIHISKFKNLRKQLNFDANETG
jgi:hypothetical protein